MDVITTCDVSFLQIRNITVHLHEIVDVYYLNIHLF